MYQFQIFEIAAPLIRDADVVQRISCTSFIQLQRRKSSKTNVPLIAIQSIYVCPNQDFEQREGALNMGSTIYVIR